MISTLLAAALLTAAPDMAPLKVFADVPEGEAEWRVEVTTEGQTIPVVTTCTDALTDMKKKMVRSEIQSGRDGACKTELVTNTPAKAEIRSACKEERMRIVMTSAGKRAWSIEVWDAAAPKTPKVRATYQHVGPCTGERGEVKLDKDSPLCEQLRTQMKMLRPEMCAAQAGDAKAKCEAQIAEAREKMAKMCR